MQQVLTLALISLATAQAAPLTITREFQGHSGPIRAVSYTPDGQTIVVASGGLAHLLDSKTLKSNRVFPIATYHPTFVWKTSSVFQTVSSGSVNTYDLTAGKQVASVRPAKNSYGHISVSANGLAAVEADGYVEVYDLGSGIRQKTFPISSEFVVDIDLSPDGTLLAVSEFEHAWLYDVSSGRIIKRLEMGRNTPASAAFGGELLAVTTRYSTNQLISIYDRSTGDHLFDFPASSSHRNIGFSPDGRFLAVPAYETVYVYDVHQKRAVLSFDAPTSANYAYGFSPDSKTLVFGSVQGHLYVADLGAGRVVRQLPGLPGNSIHCFKIDPKGQQLLTCGYDRAANVFDLATGAIQRKLSGHLGEVDSGAFLSDGHIITTSVNSLYLWKNGSLVRKSAAFGSYPDLLEAQPSGPAYVYTSYGSDDANIVVEDARTGKITSRTRVPGSKARALCFSRDGSHVVILGESGKLYLWDWKNGKMAATSQVHASPYEDDLALSASGKYFATTASQGGVNIYDARTLKLMRFIRHPHTVAIQFAAQSDQVIVSSEKAVTIYAVDSGRQMLRWDAPYSGNFQVLPGGTGLVFDSGPAGQPVVASLLTAPNAQAAFK